MKFKALGSFFLSFFLISCVNLSKSTGDISFAVTGNAINLIAVRAGISVSDLSLNVDLFDSSDSKLESKSENNWAKDEKRSIRFNELPIGIRVYVKGQVVDKDNKVLYEGKSESVTVAAGDTFISLVVKSVASETEDEETSLGSGSIALDLPEDITISMVQDSTYYRNSFSISFELNDGSISASQANWTATLLHNGQEFDGVSISDSGKCSLDDGIILPASDYQLYVTAAYNGVTGSNTFDLSVNAFGVPTTLTALYDYDGSSQNPYTYTLPDGSSIANVQSNENVFAFDAFGNFYALGYGSDGNPGTLYSNNEKISSTDLQIEDIMYYSGLGIEIDVTQNILYAYYSNDGMISLYKYPNLITNGSLSDSTQFTIDNSLGCSKIAIDNNKLYAIGQQDDTSPCCLWTFNLSGNVTSFTEENAVYEEVDLSSKVMNTLESSTNNLMIKDILYQEGFIYLLISDYSLPSPNTSVWKCYSHGAIARINPVSGECITLGWTSDPLNTSGKYAYIYKVNPAADNDITDYGPCKVVNSTYYPTLIKCEDLKSATDGSSLKFYTPSGVNSLTGFYGPQKFIALCPKKLVISDEGIAFYTDSNGAYNYKNVNRTVTIDLEKFAIKDAQSVSAKFDTDRTDKFPGACGYTKIATASLYNYIDGKYVQVDANDNLYYDDSAYTNITDGFGSELFSHGIPCEENQIPHN